MLISFGNQYFFCPFRNGDYIRSLGMSFKHRHLIHSISSGMWHIRQESAWGYLPQALSFLGFGNPSASFDEMEENPEEKKAKIERFVSSFAMESKPYIESWYYDYPPFLVDNVLVIPVMEVIDQEDYCGVAGTNTITKWYGMAEQDESIVGVVELMNSPGGSVFGTAELAGYKTTYSKPIVTQVVGMNCSAAQYISSASDHIQCSSMNCIVGSVGVMTSFRSFKEYYKKMGIEVRDIYSKTSPKKNEASRKAESGDDSGFTEGVLFDMDSSFMDFVKAQRPGVTQDVLDGADMTASKGIKAGLVDSVGDLKSAIERVQNLANNKTNDTEMSDSTKKMSVIKTDNAALLQVAKWSGATVTEEPENTSDTPPVQTAAAPPVATAQPDFAALIASALKPLQDQISAITARSEKIDNTQAQQLAGGDGTAKLETAEDDGFTYENYSRNK